MKHATTVRLVCVAAAMLACAVPARAQQAAGALRAGEVREGDAAARVDEYLSRLARHGFSGAVLIAAVPPGGNWATEGRVVLRRAYGLADRGASRPYTVDMVSCIGSITKQFTGAAIVKLEMMGKLSTADPISKYLPGVPPDKAGITIHQLLTHTAGFSEDLGGTDEEPIARDALVARVLAAPLAYTPGERFEYSNEGYSLAGAIVERVSGQGYEAFLREHLFLPADMNDTGYLATPWPLERLPVGYLQNGETWGRVHQRGWLPDGPGWYLRANGGIHATLDDMYRWHLALERTGVLSAEALAKYQTGHAEAFPGEKYAYGWGVRTSRRGGKVIAHNGGNQVFAADFLRYVDEGVVIIAMTNQALIPAPRLAPREIEALYFGDQPVVMPPAPMSVPRATRDALAGTYTTATGSRIVIRATEDGLEAQADDPATFGAVGRLTAPGGRFAELEARTRPLIEAAAAGNFRPMFDARKFEDGRPFEGFERAERDRWAAWRSTYGEFKGLELAGTAIVEQGDPAITVKLQFERGGPTMQYVWGPRRLFAVREVPRPAVALEAESPDTWVYYTYRQPQLTRVRFTRDGLEVEGPAGRTSAKR